jgi:cation/acetate symporter
MYKSMYGLDPKNAWVPFSQPGIVTIPLSFLAILVVSKMTAASGDLNPMDGPIGSVS